MAKKKKKRSKKVKNRRKRIKNKSSKKKIKSNKSETELIYKTRNEWIKKAIVKQMFKLNGFMMEH